MKKTLKQTKLKFYNLLAIPQLCGSENCIRKTEGTYRTPATEMRFLGSVKGCTMRYIIRTSHIRMELGTAETLNNISECRLHVGEWHQLDYQEPLTIVQEERELWEDRVNDAWMNSIETVIGYSSKP